MTLQVRDILSYHGDDYCILGQASAMFSPEQYGIYPKSLYSACWRGHHERYCINNNSLYLISLAVGDIDGKYPLINNVAVTRDGFGQHVYQHINMPLDYTGWIIVGKLDTYTKMVCQNNDIGLPTLRLNIREGQLLSVTDSGVLQIADIDDI